MAVYPKREDFVERHKHRLEDAAVLATFLGRQHHVHESGAHQVSHILRRPLVADRVYDSGALRDILRRRGIGMSIPPKRRPARWRPERGRPVVVRKEEYRHRYKVERSFAWLGNFRPLLIHWEHRFSVYRSWFAVAVLLLCLRRVCSAA